MRTIPAETTTDQRLLLVAGGTSDLQTVVSAAGEYQLERFQEPHSRSRNPEHRRTRARSPLVKQGEPRSRRPPTDDATPKVATARPSAPWRVGP